MNRILIFCFFVSLFFVGTAFGQSSKSYLRRGNQEYENKNYAEAETNYRRALTEDSAYMKALYNMASSLYKQKRYKDANFNYSKVLKSANLPDTLLHNVYYNMGNSYLQEFLQSDKNDKDYYKKLNQSIDSYKNALRILPTDANAKYNLSYALKLRPKPENDGDNKKKQQQKEQQQQDKKDEKKEQDKKEQEKKEQQEKDKKQQDQQQQQNQPNKKNLDNSWQNKQQQQKEKGEEQDPSKNEENKQQNDNKGQPKDGEQQQAKENTEPKDGEQKNDNKQINASDAARMLDALKENEKKTLQKTVLKKEKGSPANTEKDW